MWLNRTPSSPVTRQEMNSTDLVQNSFVTNLQKDISNAVLNSAGNVFENPVVKKSDGKTYESSEICNESYIKNRIAKEAIDALYEKFQQH